MRNVIFHYHFFKNAGTSFDAILARSFPGRWVEREFERPRSTSGKKEVIEWIISSKDSVAFSSHTANFPLMVIPDINVIPFIFLRHPIARLKSVYEFEKKQEPRLTFGARLAEKTTFSEYIEGSLDFVDDKQCRNFHCDKLASDLDDDRLKLIKAVSVIDEIPCFGIVRLFDESIRLFKKKYGYLYPEFVVDNVRENYTSLLSETESIKEIENILEKKLFQHLIDANSNDLILYQHALKRFKELMVLNFESI